MIRHPLLLALLILSSSASFAPSSALAASSGPTITRTDSGEVYYSSEYCRPETITAIRAWTVRRGETPAELPPLPVEGQPCRVRIDPLLPKFVLENMNRKMWNGPNCWNTALFMNGMVQGQRFSTGSEFRYWLDSTPYCTRVDEPQPGDIGAIRSPKKELHGFIYLSDDLIFQKASPTKADPYELIAVNKVMDEYLKTDERVDYYHCTPPKDFKHPALDEIKKIEARLTELSQTGHPARPGELQALQSRIAQIQTSVQRAYDRARDADNKIREREKALGPCFEYAATNELLSTQSSTRLIQTVDQITKDVLDEAIPGTAANMRARIAKEGPIERPHPSAYELSWVNAFVQIEGQSIDMYLHMLRTANFDVPEGKAAK